MGDTEEEGGGRVYIALGWVGGLECPSLSFCLPLSLPFLVSSIIHPGIHPGVHPGILAGSHLSQERERGKGRDRDRDRDTRRMRIREGGWNVMSSHDPWLVYLTRQVADGGQSEVGGGGRGGMGKVTCYFSSLRHSALRLKSVPRSSPLCIGGSTWTT